MSVVALGAVLAAGLIAPPAFAEQVQTVNAFATYESKGKVYVTGEDKGTFVGALVGDMFIESEKGPRHSGRIVCPGMMLVNLKDGKMSGNGKCKITAGDGAQAFAVWSCRGVVMVGCDGKLILTGGTGRAAGMSGSGPLSIRSTARGVVKWSPGQVSVTTFGRGILVLRDFKLMNPSK